MSSSNGVRISPDGDVEMEMDPKTIGNSEPAPSGNCSRRRCLPTSAVMVTHPRPVDLAHTGLKRSIAVALDYVGFDSADAAAMESFALAVEEYLQSLIEALKHQALSARREQPNPADFEAILRIFNLPIDSLKPHARHPIPKNVVVPKTENISVPRGSYLRPLPTLSEELSGKPEKESKEYIPSQFPEFPSRHTFVATPCEESRDKKDPNLMREEVSKAAKQGEDALRGHGEDDEVAG